MARLDRALRLFVNLAWFKLNNPDDVCVWDADVTRWSIDPLAFVVPGQKPGGDLNLQADNRTASRQSIWKVRIRRNTDVTSGRGAQTTINLSLEQFNYAISKQIAAKLNPNADTSGNEATPARNARAARQSGTTATPAQTKANIAAEDSDVPEATAASAQGDRSWALGQFLKTFIAAGKVLAMDELADLSWSDFSKDAYNFAQEFRMVCDRMDTKPDGKASVALAAATGVPAKPTARKRAA